MKYLKTFVKWSLRLIAVSALIYDVVFVGYGLYLNFLKYCEPKHNKS